MAHVFCSVVRFSTLKSQKNIEKFKNKMKIIIWDYVYSLLNTLSFKFGIVCHTDYNNVFSEI